MEEQEKIEVHSCSGSCSVPSKQSSLWEIFIKGIWKDNPGLCQLLGMCPLLAVTTSAANALGLGIATIVVMVMSSMVISLIRKIIVPEVRIPIYVVIIASLVTVVRFEIEAYFPELYQQLGIYLALIVTNCIIMGRAEAFAGKNNLLRSTVDAIACGIGFALVLFALGSIREIIGNGTLFVGAADILGQWATSLEMHFFDSDMSVLIAILPPGGFFVLAFLIAGKNALDNFSRNRADRRNRIKVINV
ncbi:MULTISPECIES: electron transport complex subunit E [unclassified Anaerobiospirillum]|uniref:electron transport complex subunit E n=1 Tax=unclassified Anaerobiospirillum TaxID=2647410 RepID=UPI001FF57924|nr:MULTISPECIES: electron transport complex subunit E [unclassified Anaerobiospirillum]MCK0535050.1 electron transport complex subunit E [Anaerobiospirillum sp. NML120511]MCK0540175.1 electron transport complex subunit E [Anaerobiospirillum sp. NML02-A-032]